MAESRTWAYFLPPDISKTLLQMELFAQNIMNIDHQPSKRARKAQCNQVGQKKKETKNEREGHWMGPVPEEEAVKEKVPAP